jgi:cephalosporin-C deacetylase-like acetyl esterase
MLHLIPIALLLLAADKPDTTAGDTMIDKYLAGLAKDLSGRFLDGAKTREKWQQKLPRLHREYFDMLGLWPVPEKTPLRATVTGTLEHEGVVIEKLHYQSRPGLYVTGNLYRPKEPKGRLPAILYVCGHSGKGRDGNKTAFQDHGLWFANNGYVCLIVDTLQLGEIPGVHHGTYGIRNENYAIRKDPAETRWWWQALGYTPAGVECWNGIRGIDYLISRPDVDAERIGVTGISGGGAATFWIAAADERVKVAVPVSGMSDLGSYVTNKVINGHCDCMFLVNTYQWDWTTIAALIAPRPLLFANSDNDTIFPMDGNRRVMAKLRQVYQMYGKPELLDEYISKGGHEDRADLRVGAFGWMNKHLKNDTAAVKYEPFKQLPGKELRVFPEDEDLPKDALNGKIDETFVKRAEVKLPEAGKFAEWKAGMLKDLRALPFLGMAGRIHQAELRKQDKDRPEIRHMTTEPGIEVATIDISGRPGGTAKSEWLIVGNPGEDYAKLGPRIATLSDEGDHVVLLLPRGVENSVPKLDKSWTVKSPPNYVERSHALLGLTVDRGRVYDIAAMAQHLSRDGVRVKVVGRGQAGVLAAYAALVRPVINEVVILDPPTSHKDGPTFLNVLRLLDIPEALGLLAPNVKLTLINAKDKAFDRTAQLYNLAGAEEKFRRE